MKIQTFYNRQSWRSVTAVLLVFILSGCASSRYTVLEPASEPLSSFEILEITDFTSNLSDENSVELANRFADQLHQAILDERKKNPGGSTFREVVRNIQQNDSVLVLDGVVISFEKGSRALRYFVGFGAGKAYCTIQSTFTNKETGEVVLKANFDGELSMSVFGGSPERAVKSVVKAYIKYLDEYFEV